MLDNAVARDELYRLVDALIAVIIVVAAEVDVSTDPLMAGVIIVPACQIKLVLHLRSLSLVRNLGGSIVPQF